MSRRIAAARDTAPLRALLEPDPFDLALRLGLLVLILDASLHWFERVPQLLPALVGLVFPAAARSRGLWLALLALTTWPLVWNWPFSDNHDYLMAFWCLAVACALSSPDPRGALAQSARLLVGLTFAFASIWKLVLSPDFLDGTFFRVTLLTDGRFENLAVLAGGISYEQWEANESAVEAFLSGSVAWSESGFVEPPQLVALARAATFFAGASEAAIALAFLWPLGGRPSRLRHALLLLFALFTYPFATVRGFGWLLMTLGVAQCERQRRRTCLAYVSVFFMIEVFRSVPWDDALVSALGLG